jgi:hypothetical protein
MAQIIIPDEWLIHDLKGDNGENRQREALVFLEKLYAKCDRLAILDGSSFLCKFYKLLMKDLRLRIREISKFLNLCFIRNADKCVKLPVANELPESLKEEVPEDDQYLYQIRQTLRQGIIVTTDEKDLRNLPNTVIRKKFLEEYDHS